MTFPRSCVLDSGALAWEIDGSASWLGAARMAGGYAEMQIAHLDHIIPSIYPSLHPSVPGAFGQMWTDIT
jgi:hypothetical protein